MNDEEYKELGLYGLVVTGATKAFYWLSNRLKSAEQYNRERDREFFELMKVSNVTNELILEKQKSILIALEKLNDILLKTRKPD